MAKILTESATFSATVTIPEAGDALTAASVEPAFQGLANRTQSCKARLDDSLVAINVTGAVTAGSNAHAWTPGTASHFIAQDNGDSIYDCIAGNNNVSGYVASDTAAYRQGWLEYDHLNNMWNIGANGALKWSITNNGIYPASGQVIGNAVNRVLSSYIDTLTSITMNSTAVNSVYVSCGATPSLTGQLRLSNGGGIVSRNSSDTADYGILALSSNLEVGSSSANTVLFGDNYVSCNVGGSAVFRIGDVNARPTVDNAISFGTAAYRPTELFAVAGTINTSDEREKANVCEITGDIIDAWSGVSFVFYQWISSVDKKGDEARIHTGVIAQSIYREFEAHGIDAFRYGLLCYDKWGESESEDGGIIPAGDRWGIRADQCLFLEAAYQRRRCARIEARLDALEAFVNA